MKLKNQVANLKLSQKLWELGVITGGIFSWCEDGGLQLTMLCHKDKILFPAPTATELGEIIYSNNVEVDCECSKFDNLWEYNIEKSVFVGEWINEQLLFGRAKTEADARAKVLIYLLENDIMKIEDINK